MSTAVFPTTTGYELTSDQLELQQRARTFVETVLIPLELEAEELGGQLPHETVEHVKREAIAARLHGGRFAPEYGGQGWSMFEWYLVNEQFGRVTNGLHWHVPNAYNVLLQGTPEQIERYLVPALRGEGGDAYAVTEAEAGSDPGGIASTAVPSSGGWRINGEKWFVTSGDVARVLIVMANVVDGSDRLPTLFLIEPGAAGVDFVDNPRFTHNYPHGHPTIRFTDVEVGVRRGDRRRRQRRGSPARVVHRGAARNRHARARRDVAAARRDDRVGARASSGRSADHGLPGDLVPARRLGDRRNARPPARAPCRRDDRRRRRREADPRQGGHGEAVRLRGRRPLRRPGRAGVRRPRLPPEQRRRAVQRASSGSTGSGRAPARCSD